MTEQPIPAWAEEKARQWFSNEILCANLAAEFAAIDTAAERRGAERMRERAAKVAWNVSREDILALPLTEEQT